MFLCKQEAAVVTIVASSKVVWCLNGASMQIEVKDRCFWFDESYEHDLLHTGDQRASFILDVRHPALDGRIPSAAWHEKVLAVEPESPDSTCEDLPGWPFHSRSEDLIFMRLKSGLGMLEIGVFQIGLAKPACSQVQVRDYDGCLSRLTLLEGTSPTEAVRSFALQQGLLRRTEAVLDFVSTNLPYHAGVEKPWSTKHGGGHSRTSVLSYLQQRFGLARYLEIGCDDGGHFASLRQRFHVSECVDPRPGGTLEMTSDAYFSSRVNGEKFDLVLVDGLHTGQQALRDVENTLNVLEPGGFIVMHDCNPNSASQASPQRLGAFHWTGDVFRAVVALRQRADLDVAVGDFDFGVAVLRRRPRRAPAQAPALHPPLKSHEVWNMSYADFALRREELLNLMTWWVMLQWIG